MHCTRMHSVKDTIQTHGIKEISRDTMWVAGEFNVLQTCDVLNLKDCVFVKVRYRGKGDRKVVRAAPYVSRSLIYLAVKNDHLAVEPFESADAKIPLFQESRRPDRTRVHAFDESGRSRNLIHAARRRVQVFTQRRVHKTVN